MIEAIALAHAMSRSTASETAPWRPAMNPAIFREYDIRGIADHDYDVELRARCSDAPTRRYVADKGVKRVSVGRDCRLTSEQVRRRVEGRPARGRARRRRSRHDADAARLLLALPPRRRRRHPGDRQPQSARSQRLQDLRRQGVDLRRRRSRSSAGSSRAASSARRRAARKSTTRSSRRTRTS